MLYLRTMRTMRAEHPTELSTSHPLDNDDSPRNSRQRRKVAGDAVSDDDGYCVESEDEQYKTTDDVDVKIEKRRIRNRQSALESRQRKNLEITELRQKIGELEEQAKCLRRQVASYEQLENIIFESVDTTTSNQCINSDPTHKRQTSQQYFKRSSNRDSTATTEAFQLSKMISSSCSRVSSRIRDTNATSNYTDDEFCEEHFEEGST
jgi:hypothetical protein